MSASDGFSAKFTSATLKRNDNWIVADTVNGTALPKLDGKGKMFWPLKLVGSETTSGSQRIANITSITLENLPSAPTAAFTSDVQNGNAPLTVKFTDQSTGTGPLTFAWDFNNDGSVDNTTESPTYTYPNPGTYSVNLTVTNGIGSDTELKTNYITVTAVPVVNDWSITLNGAGSEVLTRTNFETLAEGNRLTYNDGSSTWSGVALWRILARVDDSNPATFNDAVADLGYTVNVSASDGFSANFASAILKRNDNWIVADTVNGTALPKLDGKGKKFWPLKLVGSETTSGSQRVANITYITLENLPSAPDCCIHV